MPAIDPSWFPRTNGAIIGRWLLVMRHAVTHSGAGAFIERGIGRDLNGLQVSHLSAAFGPDVLCAVRDDGHCVPALDEVHEQLLERVVEMGDDCPELLRTLLAPPAKPEEGGDASKEALAEEIAGLRSKATALAFAKDHAVIVDEGMKLAELRELLHATLVVGENVNASAKHEPEEGGDAS